MYAYTRFNLAVSQNLKCAMQDAHHWDAPRVPASECAAIRGYVTRAAYRRCHVVHPRPNLHTVVFHYVSRPQ